MKDNLLRIWQFAKYDLPARCHLVARNVIHTRYRVVFRGRLALVAFNLCFAPCTQAVSD